jgi:hypothetical protein
MTSEDRDLLLTLRRQQSALHQSLEQIDAQLNSLETRFPAAAPEPILPPIPAEAFLPPLPPPDSPEPVLPPIPAFASLPPLPPLPSPPAPKPSLEFRFGRWLTRIGALFLVLTLISIASWFGINHVFERLAPAGKLSLMGLISLAFIILGQRIEHNRGALYFGRTVLGAGLAGLYVTFYSAYSVPALQVITSPLLEGILLLLWSAYVLLLAERKKSHTLALFAVTLAYLSTALNPSDRFTMTADLLLAATATVFLIRHGWALLAALSVIGTYFALLRRLVVDPEGYVVLDTSRTLHLLPHAVYLVCAWFLFTTGIIFTRSPAFRGGVRLALASLNNAALAGLLTLTAYIAGYGLSSMGWALLDTGLVFLVTSRIAGFAEYDPVDLMGAYAAQGLALLTGGIIVVFTGVTRGVLLLLETLLLGIAGAFAGDRILTVSTYVSGAFATMFVIWEIAANSHHPWLLGFGGALIMLINAWACRCEVRDSPQERSTIVPSTSCFCALALGLIFTAEATDLSQGALPVALAFTALFLTFAIYYVSIYELPPLAQTLLLAAQVLVIFPVETGEELPWWSIAWVGLITLLLVSWWSRQRVTRTGPWTVLLTFIYGLALVGLVTQQVRPYLGAPGWMIASSLLSVAFLVFGAFTRVWAIAAMGQLFLLIAVRHFFQPVGGGNGFPWSWATAAVPIVVVFTTARAAHQWLRLFTNIPESWRSGLRLLAYGYQLLALAMLVRWVFAVVPETDQVACFLFLGTLLLSWNLRDPALFGIRCSFVLTTIGMLLYIENFNLLPLATPVNALAMLLFLCQPGLLRRDAGIRITRLESWTLILSAVGTAWIFVSMCVLTRFSIGYLTMGWSLYALFLFVFGLLLWERRLRWCGLIVLLAAILRVFCSDFWGLSGGYRVLTFVVLTFITLSLGYVILRVADRRQSWL